MYHFKPYKALYKIIQGYSIKIHFNENTYLINEPVRHGKSIQDTI